MSRDQERDAGVGHQAPLSERAPFAAQKRIDAFFDGEADVLALESSPPEADECEQGEDACPYSHGSRDEAPARAA
jgi:hypothetical protein